MISKLLRYWKLFRAHRIAKRFYASYEHLTRDVKFHPELDIRLDVYSPGEGTGYPVLIFVHGGGWSHFDKVLFAPAAMKLLPEKMVVVIPDHTKYPHATYRQMVQEIAGVISWTLENIGEYGGDPRRVVVTGQSSGGHLVGLAAMDPSWLAAYGHAADELGGVIYISAGGDLHTHYAYEQVKGNGKETDLMKTMEGVIEGVENFTVASPITYVRSDLPPTLIVHGGADQTIPVDNAAALHRALQEAGASSELIVYPGRGHNDLLFSALTEERAQIVVDMSAFVHNGRAGT